MNKRIERATTLAKEMNRIEKNIQGIVDSGESNFDVYYLEEAESWIVHTSYCQIGGCLYGYIEAANETEARSLAAEKTYYGENPTTGGVCAECRQEMYDM